MGNFLRSNGQPVKQLDVSWLPGLPPPRPSQNRVGASVKRRLQLEDDNQLSSAFTLLHHERPRLRPTLETAGTGHVKRSQARLSFDIPIVPTPIFDQAKGGRHLCITTQAPALSISASAGAQPSSVPEVSTLSEKQEITSLVLKQPTTSWSAPQLKDVLASQRIAKR